jgi:hypothetical protein
MGGISYPDGFHIEMDMIPEATTDFGMFGIFLAVYLLLMFFAMAFSIVCYVFQSYGFYTIASRRGIRNSWLAWVPVGNVWVLGSISDQYQYVAKGKIKNRRKLLLGLELGMIGFLVGLLIAAVIIIAMNDAFFDSMLLAVLLVLLGYLAIIALAITTTVYMYLCYYDLFNSCNPGNAVLFLVLSIIFPVTLPFFVFVCRKKDLGMPPRKQPASEPVIEILAEEPAEESAEEPVMEEGYAQPEEFEEE